MKLIIASFSVLLLASCAFNNFLYHPDTNQVPTPPDAVSKYIKYGENDSIHSLFYERKNPIASIFILHGNAGNLEGWSQVSDLFYQANYQVLILDYPGFGNSSGKAKHKAVYAATQAAVEVFNELPQVANTKKLLMGFSLGGNLALKVGHDNPDLFDAMLIEGAFNNHKTVAVQTVPRPFRFAPFLLVKSAIKGEELITTWDKPLLIVHSEDDVVCPYKMGEELFQSAVSTDKKELWTINGPHLSGLSSNFDLYMAKVKKLIGYQSIFN